jgi:cellobiose phosphorylase
VTRGEAPDVYKAEPYVYAEYVMGPDSCCFGQGEFTWMTGTAAWMWKVCLERILGVRPHFDGLLIDPCIPAAWDEFKVKRHFRESLYIITVRNPEHVHKGVKSLALDGVTQPGNLITPVRDGGMHEVHVTMGRIEEDAQGS